MISIADFGTAVREQRRRLRLSQKELADAAGISRTYLSLLENRATINPSYGIVVKLTQILSLETSDKPERVFTASCYLCRSDADLQMLPHRKNGYLVGWIFACAKCAPSLHGAELVATIFGGP